MLFSTRNHVFLYAILLNYNVEKIHSSVYNRLFFCEQTLKMLCCTHEMSCSAKKLCVLFLIHPIYAVVARIVTREPVVCTANQAVFVCW